jgi:hypothetical protein
MSRSRGQRYLPFAAQELRGHRGAAVAALSIDLDPDLIVEAGAGRFLVHIAVAQCLGAGEIMQVIGLEQHFFGRGNLLRMQGARQHGGTQQRGLGGAAHASSAGSMRAAPALREIE